MADKTVFTEAVDLLATDPANVQAAQLLHIMVTGGPAPTVEQARATVKAQFDAISTLFTP